MVDSASHPAPARHAVALTALWIGLFGAALAWTLQELIAYAMVAHACFPSWKPYRLPTIRGTWGVTTALALVLLVLGGAGTAVAYRSWTRTRPPRSDSLHHQTEVGEGRGRFMALGGLLVSGMILFSMLMNVIVLFLIDPCG
jgi:uncharacterized oligopeptide transporter (OPT) family protein